MLANTIPNLSQKIVIFLQKKLNDWAKKAAISDAVQN
ncbi:Uncharacterised protein [Legionella pneumophila]|nr:hypothetical protein [Legionella pneumophila subsp. pneumophila]CZG09921.1 Uncharacterised protein [Legionella pneumophila]CZH19948.1 Uncharacterised protein [Legionella pneumophila]CZH21088.1 Uncharacterised protein [Legionella pneumophila]CZH34057.1 Uncharacterised protein [Legionella pneumophila]